MDAVEMLKEKVRLTKDCTINCSECRLSMSHSNSNYTCGGLLLRDPKRYVEIIEQWSKDCPKKTYLSKLFEAFPNTELSKINNMPHFCPSHIGLKNIEKCKNIQPITELPCDECWNQEIS